MTPKQICRLNFWIHTDEPLDVIATALKTANIIGEYDRDFENVYEWFTCTPVGHDFELNVSRKHHDEDLDFDEPLAFLLIGRENYPAPSEKTTIELANAVHQSLKRTVYIGTIEYLGGDEYRHFPTQTLET